MAAFHFARLAGFDRPLTESTLARAKGMVAGAMSSIGAGIGLALGNAFGQILARIAEAPLKLVEMGSSLEEMRSKFTAVFKEEEGAARQFAETLSQSIGRSQVEIETFMSGMQDLFVPMGFARGQARELSGTITSLAYDLASFNNLTDSDTIESLKSGLAGSTEVLRKFGVFINDNTLGLKLQEMGFAKNAQAATEQQKMLARLQIVLESTRDAQGDAARTSDSLANQWKALKGSVFDLASQIGGGLGPAAKAIVAQFRELAAWAERNKETIKAVAASIGNAFATVFGWLATAVKGLYGVFAGLWERIGGASAWAKLVAGAQAAWDSIVGLWGRLTAALASVWEKVSGPALTAFNGIVDGVKGLWNRMVAMGTTAVGSLVGLWDRYAGAVGSAFSKVVGVVVGIVSQTVGMIQATWAKVAESGAWDKLVSGVSKVVGYIADLFTRWASSASAIWDQYGGAVMSILSRLYDSIVGNLVAAWSVVQGVVSSVADAIYAYMATVIDFMASLWQNHGDTITGIWDGIASVVVGAFNVIGSVFTTAGGWIKQFIDWLSGLFSAAVTYLGGAEGCANGVGNAMASMSETIGNVVSAVYGWLVDKLGPVWDWLSDKVGQVVGAIKGFIEDVVFSVLNWSLTTEQLGLTFAETFENMLIGVRTFGENAVIAFKWIGDNWWDIIKTACSYIVNALKNLASNLWELMKGVWDSVTTMSLDPLKNAMENIDWSKITEGAKNSIKAMPEFKPTIATDKFDAQKADLAKRWAEANEKWEKAKAPKPKAEPKPKEDTTDEATDNWDEYGADAADEFWDAFFAEEEKDKDMQKKPGLNPYGQDFSKWKLQGAGKGEEKEAGKTRSVADVWKEFQASLLKTDGTKQTNDLLGQLNTKTDESNQHLANIAKNKGNNVAVLAP